MGLPVWLSADLGLLVFSAICFVLTVYLIYAMLHPEEF